MKALLRPTWAKINLDALANNYQEVKSCVGPLVKILGVVKADAYGHGSVECAHTLCDAGVDMLGVAFIDEAIALRQAGVRAKILILGFTPKESISDLIRFDVIPGVYHYSFAQALSDYCESAGIIHPIHVKIDTGMGRIGFHREEALEAVIRLSKLKGIELQGIYSHLSTADAFDKTYSQKQGAYFKEIIQKLEDFGIEIPLKHLANSAGIFDLEGLHFNMVRPGIILYGLYPSSEVNRAAIDLKPVMTLKSTIVHLKTLKKGESVSYGNRFVAESERLIATIPIGYADGFSRILSGKAMVKINDYLVPVVGNICMDQCMLDVTELEEIRLSDTVEIFGENISADVLANLMGTINYEIVCMVNKRVPRVYYKEGAIKSLRQDILEKQYRQAVD